MTSPLVDEREFGVRVTVRRTDLRSGRWRRLAPGLTVLLLAGAATVYFLWPRPPGPDSPQYRQMVSAFYTGLAGLEVNELEQATKSLELATELVPEEPAAWANLGLTRMRRGALDEAMAALQQARSLATESAEIEMLLARLEGLRGRFVEGIAHLQRAAELDPRHLQARYALAQELERAQGPDADAKAATALEDLGRLAPDNLALLLESARLAAKRGDVEGLRRTAGKLGELSKGWPPEALDQYRGLVEAVNKPDARASVPKAMMLRNVLVRTPEFRRDLARVQIPAEEIGRPVERFLRLASPLPLAAAPDRGLSFELEAVATAQQAPKGSRWNAALAIPLTGDAEPALFVANSRELRQLDGAGVTLLSGDGTSAATANAVAGLDWSHDFRMDLALCGGGGVRLNQQNDLGNFDDVTSRALEGQVANEECNGIWAADVESDGDLDLIQSLARGACRVLRNNGDGTFRGLDTFPGSSLVRDFGWADLDEDGDPDAAILDGDGRLRLWMNERSGRFVAGPSFADHGVVMAIAVADADRDGRFELLALRSDGQLLRVSSSTDTPIKGGDEASTLQERRGWEVAEVNPWQRPDAQLSRGPVRLVLADFDNNGAADLLATGPVESRVWLADEHGAFELLTSPIPLGAVSPVVRSANGRVELFGLSKDGQPMRALSRGTKAYHWQVVRPRAQDVPGDQRINSFGLGGEIQIRAGLLVQKQPILGPIVHFGLGEQEAPGVLRIVWPNGVAQAEFGLTADRTVVAQQRLKGSCPWLFAFDGKAMRFVTDILWRSPLGLRINAQDTAGVAQTEDRVKLGDMALAPREGQYDLRITAELWETHFFDSVGLLAVDHPRGTEVWTDERFAIPPASLELVMTGPLRTIQHALDERGRDVTALVRELDGRFLDTFELGRYQGMTSDHFVEIELGEAVPPDRPLWLLAHGWIYPTDSSINLALGQGRQTPPRPLALEAADGAGGWRVVYPNLGFPAGKNKTILIDLRDAFEPGAPRRLRLSTNLEVYWDALWWAEALPDAPRREVLLAPVSAELRYRGFSATSQAGRRAPDLPDYQVLRGTDPLWIDLEGYYTRFGDVIELLRQTDDRSVIMNAGDEMQLRFEALAPPRDGWKRTFVFLSDGWEKDGDLNTGFSRTVLPMPSHDSPEYSAPPGRLEDDPIYRRYPGDWQTYHTRYVTPSRFFRALWPDAVSTR